MKTGKTYLMDSERICYIAEVPDGLNTDCDEVYAEICRLHRELNKNRKSVEKEYKRAVKEITKRQNGWCSIADVQNAGFDEFGRKIVPEEMLRDLFFSQATV